MPMPMQIERRRDLAPDEFLDRYLAGNTPVIVVDAMSRWDACAKWQPEFLIQQLGRMDVQVYDALFKLRSVMPLERYLRDNFNRPAERVSHEYVRWYSKLRDVDFCWADQAFRELACDWATPYFLPTTSMLVPYCPPPAAVDAVRDLFPYRGLFISGRGARTRLHHDPFGSQAVLCQFVGHKALTFYSPASAGRLITAGGWVDIHEAAAAELEGVEPTYVDELAPGEVLFIPDGWLHDVVSLSDSISITWNFVHARSCRRFVRALSSMPGDPELEVVRFFLSIRDASVASAPAMLSMLTRSFTECAEALHAA